MDRLVSGEVNVQTVAAGAEERVPWHKPTVEQLQVSLDTQYNHGSTVDCEYVGDVAGDYQPPQICST